MRCSPSIQGGLAAALVLAMAPVLAQGLPTISVNPHEHQEGRFNFPVLKEIRLDRASPTAVTGRFSMNQQRAIEGAIGVATPGASCGPGVDFIELNQVPFTIPAGQLSTTVPITFCGDRVQEGDETLSLTIHAESLVGAQCSANGLSCKAQAKIIDSPDFVVGNPVWALSTRAEAGVTVPTVASVRFELMFNIVTGDTSFTFSIRTVDGTARSGNPAHFAPGQCTGIDPSTGATVTRDYIPKTDVVFSPSGVLGIAPVDIQICPQATAQPEKSFFLEIFNATGVATLANGRAQVFIQDAPTLSVSNATVTEPSTGRRLVKVNASLLEVPVNPVAISFRTRNGTATAQTGATSVCNGVGDFLGASSGSATIAAPQKGNAGGFTYICADTLTERDESFFFDLTVDTSRVRVSNSTARVTILDTPLSVGGFQFSPDRAQIKVDAITTFSVDWTLPEPQVWRNLNTIEMLIHDDERDTLTVLWKELENTFHLCRTPKASSSNRSGRSSNDDDHDDDDAIRSGIPRQGCSAGHLPGSNQVLETRYARLHLADTTVVGSGPTGQSVTLNMAISFKDKARGEQTVELAASNDMRQSDPFVRAGRVQVVRAR